MKKVVHNYSIIIILFLNLLEKYFLLINSKQKLYTFCYETGIDDFFNSGMDGIDSVEAFISLSTGLTFFMFFIVLNIQVLHNSFGI